MRLRLWVEVGPETWTRYAASTRWRAGQLVRLTAKGTIAAARRRAKGETRLIVGRVASALEQRRLNRQLREHTAQRKRDQAAFRDGEW